MPLLQARIGGGAANVATVLARLGAEARLIAAVGDDPIGARLTRSLAAEGVTIDAIARLAGRTALCFVEPSAPEGRRYFGHRQGAADRRLSPSMIPERLGARWCVAFGLMASTPVSRAALEHACTLAHRESMRFALDFAAHPHLWPEGANVAGALLELASRADVVQASREDLARLGVDDAQLADALVARRGWIAITEGAAGARLFDGARWHVATARPARSVDPSGAGDAFFAGLLRALDLHRATAFGDDFEGRARLAARALSIATTLGAQAVEARGATEGVVELGEVRAAIEAPLRAPLHPNR
jgi:sugar/nucleoside kinase (ribokinase family)